MRKIVSVLIDFILIFIVIYSIQFYGSKGETTILIKKVVYGRQYNRFAHNLVYTDKGVFYCESELLLFDFSGNDRLFSLEEGKSYSISYYGLDKIKNITNIK